ncbi:phosphotransferase [Terrabacter sp. 2RAF25]|uniref:phosphotransferase n=1 Tax=Terrabacter sp. 2RAF25 TaxID=3232998 RepID=UPI003F9D44E3
MPSATDSEGGADRPDDPPRRYAALPEEGPGPSVRWASEGFAAELRTWLEEALGGLGSELVRLEPVHQRPWSTVWRALASDGTTYWAKQNCAHQSFEAALLVVLDRLAPDRVVPVVAADLERGLHLAPDQGPVFADTVADDDVDAWCRVAAEAMHLQRELVGHERELEAAGAALLHPTHAAAYVSGRTASLVALPEGDPRRMGPEVAARLDRLLPTVARWGEELDALGTGVNLVHNDLHPNNVFARPGGMRFFDFGDAVLTHPLTALFIPLNVLVHRFEAAPDDPRLRRVADAGLEVWSDVVPATRLRRALPAALQLGRLARAESWLRVVATMTAEERTEYGDAGTWWLGSLGEPTPLS